jgi:hypothetical protein
MRELDVRICQAVAKDAYFGIKRRDGSLLYDHAVRISNQFINLQSVETASVAILHDVLTKTDWDVARLRKEAIPRAVMESLIMLVQRNDETWIDYLHRISIDPVCRFIKLAEMHDDLDCMPTELERKEFSYGTLLLGGWPTKHFMRDCVYDELKVPNRMRGFLPEHMKEGEDE